MAILVIGGGSGGGGGGGGTASTFGAVFPSTGTAAGFIDNSGNMAGATLDASGFLKVNVAAGGGSGGTSATFGAAFPGTGTAAGFKDASGNMSWGTLDTNGFLKVSGGQEVDYDTGAGTVSLPLFGMALPASGGPVAGGTSTNPIRIDPTGTTAQPITDNGGSITVDGTLAVTNAGTFATQDSQTITDNAAFTDGTSKVFMSGFVYDEVAGTALTENDAAAGRVDNKRAVVFTLEDASTRGQRATVTAAGAVKIDGSASTQPISGTVTANAGTNLNTSALALESGGNLATIAAAVRAEDTASADADKGIGALAIRKATPANTSGTDGDYEFLQMSAGRVWASATIDAALPAGSNVIGHVIADSGSTTAVTGNVTVVQATGTNLHAVLDAGTALIGTTISPAETSTIYNGTTALTPKFAKIAASSSGNNALVAAVTSKKIRVVSYNFMANGTVNAKFQSDGAGTPTDLTGLKYCIANTGICCGYNPVGWFESGSGKSLDLNLSAAIAVGGELTYIEV